MTFGEFKTIVTHEASLALVETLLVEKRSIKEASPQQLKARFIAKITAMDPEEIRASLLDELGAELRAEMANGLAVTYAANPPQFPVGVPVDMTGKVKRPRSKAHS